MSFNTFTVSHGCLMMVLSSALHHWLKLLSSAFQTNPKQVTSFNNSAKNTAVVEMNMSPGLVRAYRMDSPKTAFWPVRVTRLRYLGLKFSSLFMTFLYLKYFSV